jgi:hypothetical protein
LVMDFGWVPQRLTNVRYVDTQSWTSDQRRVMPGRSEQTDAQKGAEAITNAMRARHESAILREARGHAPQTTK